jgi:hypothetical protein
MRGEENQRERRERKGGKETIIKQLELHNERAKVEAKIMAKIRQALRQSAIRELITELITSVLNNIVNEEIDTNAGPATISGPRGSISQVSSDSRSPIIDPTDSSSTTDDEHEVEAIVNHRYRRGCIEYKVRWSGYDESFDTWHRKDALSSCQDLIEEYKNRLREMRRRYLDLEAI